MPKLTTGRAIVEDLIRRGVDTIFGVPGAQTYAIFDALYQAGERIRLIAPSHEQAAAYMANGYARSTGRPGVYTVVPGPGALNTMAALSVAVATNQPVLCLTAQTPSEFIGKGRGHLHELPDQLATLRSLVKWAARIEHPGDALALVAEAFSQMTSGRPGPVALEVPWDVLDAEAEFKFADAAPPPRAGEPDRGDVAAAAAMIAAAKSPMIYVGGGALDAADEVRELAERLGAPVSSFRSGRGIVGDDHPLGFPLPAAHALWPETDLLIGIGSRLEGPYMRWNQMRWVDRPATPKLVRIDIDAVEMERLPPDAGIVGDARTATSALNAALAAKGTNFEDRSARLAAVKRETVAAFAKIQPQMSYLGVIRDLLPRDGFFVEEQTQAGFTSRFAFPVYAPRTYVTSGYQDALGFGFMTALGVKVANPDRAVVSVTGDGGFMFGLQELATAVQFDIGVVTVLFNNNAYGNVRRDQMNRFDGRVIGAELHNPDFVDLARSFGAEAARAESPEQLRPMLAAALEADRPALLEVAIAPDSETSPWEFIHPPPG